MESLPLTHGNLYARQTRSSSRFALTSWASLNLPSGVFSDWIGSGQQKLSNPAILSTSTPTHTAFLTASSIAAAAIAPASISE